MLLISMSFELIFYRFKSKNFMKPFCHNFIIPYLLQQYGIIKTHLWRYFYGIEKYFEGSNYLHIHKNYSFFALYDSVLQTHLIACSNKSVSVVMCGHNNFLRNFFSIFNLNHLLRRISYQHSTNEHKNWMIKGVATITCH